MPSGRKHLNPFDRSSRCRDRTQSHILRQSRVTDILGLDDPTLQDGRHTRPVEARATRPKRRAQSGELGRTVRTEEE